MGTGSYILVTVKEKMFCRIFILNKILHERTGASANIFMRTNTWLNKDKPGDDKSEY